MFAVLTVRLGRNQTDGQDSANMFFSHRTFFKAKTALITVYCYILLLIRYNNALLGAS